MTDCKIHPLGSFEDYRYTVIFARYQGQWVFPRHRERETFETAGGHIEPGETPMEGASRELWEETGAEEFTIRPVCDYWAQDELGFACGVVFYAEISAFGELPADFEMREVGLFDGLPEQLTYPYITPVLFEEVKRQALQKSGPENSSFQIRENALSPQAFRELFSAVGWEAPPLDQIQKALDNSLCTFAAYQGDQIVGMARLLGDGAMSYYVKDLAVAPAFQGKGIGRRLVACLEGYIRRQLPGGWAVSLELISAPRKESFYAKLGFEDGASGVGGAGLIKMIRA